jgi:hypothetical protein
MLTSDTGVLNHNRFFGYTLPDSKPIQHPSHIWCQLNPSTDEAQVGGRLINLDILEASFCKCQGAGQTANACELELSTAMILFVISHTCANYGNL